MPRPSGNPDKARSGGGGVEKGNYEVTAAVFRNMKTDFKPNQPTLILNCAVLDKDGDKVRGAEDVEMFFGMGEKSLEAFHPGQSKSADDADPQDMGTEVDAEGNTIYCANDGDQFNRSCGFVVFNESLTKQGYPKDVLDQTYAPNYVGLKFALDTLDSKTINEKMGTRLSTKPTKDGGTVTYKVATQWLNTNYLSAGKSGEAKHGKANGEGKAEKLGDSGEVATALLGRIAATKKGPKDKLKSVQQLVGLVAVEYQKAKLCDPKAVPLPAVQKYFKDEEWLGGALAEIDGCEIEYQESGAISSIQFAA